jgi:hypothetical protein
VLFPLQLQKLINVVIQILMAKFNGIGVILENRYYGKSYPYNTSTTDELRFLTTEQSKSSEQEPSEHILTYISHCRQCLLQTACYVSGY